MSKAWKAGAIGLIVFALVWLATLWRWQTSEADVGGVEMLTHLLVLPVMLLLIWWVAQKMAWQWRSGMASAASAPAPAEATALAGADEALRRFSVALVDARLSLMAGDGARDVARQVTERQVWPSLDEHLQDVDGNPVFSARVADLDLRDGDEHEPVHVARARALLWRVWWPLCSRLGDALDAREVRQRLTPGDPDEQARADVDERPAHLAGLGASRPGTPPQTGRMTIHILLALPTHWQADQHEHTLRQLQESLPDHLPREGDGLAWHWSLFTAEEPETLWVRVDTVLQSWARTGEAGALLVLAADSALDERMVAQRQARGELFTAVHQQGRIPGEGAAALWLASPAWPGLDALETAPTRLHRPIMARRDKSADALGRVGSAVLQQSLRAAQSLPQVPPGHAGHLLYLASDGDHRASRTGEVYEALTELCPELDPTVSVCRLGDACGDLGLAGVLAPTVLAAALLPEGAEPTAGSDDKRWPLTLAACVQSPWQRVVLVLSPWANPSVATD